MLIGMAIGVLVEAFLPGGTASIAGKSLPKDEKGVKEWIRNKLKALRILSRVGWVSQNLWALVVGNGGLLYMYIVTKK